MVCPYLPSWTAAWCGNCRSTSTSRSIEGENPLYLPQAKIYAGSCSVHSAIRPAWELTLPEDLAIRCEIRRAGDVVWEAAGSTSHMRRSFAELVEWAFRGQDHPAGMILSTGTMLVPDMATTLEEGDLVVIEVEGLGTLRNLVRRGHAHEHLLGNGVIRHAEARLRADICA